MCGVLPHRLDRHAEGAHRGRRDGRVELEPRIEEALRDEVGEGVCLCHRAVVLRCALLDQLAPDLGIEPLRARHSVWVLLIWTHDDAQVALPHREADRSEERVGREPRDPLPQELSERL